MKRKRLRSDTCLLCEFEPKSMNDALDNEDGTQEMNEEIQQIENDKIWTLVPMPKDKNVIGTTWVFRNKLNEKGQVTRNRARFVCKGYSQEEGVDYREIFSLLSRLEGVRTLLEYFSYKVFKVYQIDVTYSFLNEILEE